MRFSLGLPIDGIGAVARAAESAGFDACYVTDHPFPPARWLRDGGHEAHDPFVALSFAAAATTTLRLQTHILVLPYRNPFIVARAAASLDVLSGGRLILGVGGGYLRGEFAALGADFDHKNAVTDDAIVAIKLAWTTDNVQLEGRGFKAIGNSMHPRPAQQPHPPIWVGGNSKRAIRRAVELGDGWVPFPNPASAAPHTRTDAIEGASDLAKLVDYAREHAAHVGRTSALDICYALGPYDDGRFDALEVLDTVQALEALGVTWLAVPFAAVTFDVVERFGRDVISAR